MPKDEFTGLNIQGEPLGNKPVKQTPVENNSNTQEGNKALEQLQRSSGVRSSEKFRGTPSLGISESQYNVNISPTDVMQGELNQIRAKNQPFHHEFGNFAMQAGAEIVGGAAEGFGYLAELAKGNAFAVDQENLLLDIGRELKEGSREDFQIYKEDPKGYMLSDSENFFSGLVSTASTLSMLIPSMTATKGLSWLGKGLASATKGGRVLGKLSNMSKKAEYIKDGVTSAVFSRNIENNLEGYQEYKTLKQELQGTTNPNTGEKYTAEEIEEAALSGAKDVYQKNWAMLAQDIPQYLALGKVFNPVTRKFVPKTSRKVGKYGKAKEFAKQSGWEGFEEGYQFVSAEESTYDVKNRMGLVEESSFSERMSDYLSDTEFWNSVTAGALGGAAFQMAGKGLDRVLNNKGRKRQENIQRMLADKRGKQFGELYANIENQDTQENETASVEARKRWNHLRTMEALQTDTFDQHIEFLEGMENITDEELQEFRQRYDTNLSKEFAKKMIPELKKNSHSIRDEFFKHSNKHDVDTASLLTLNRYNLKRMKSIRDNARSKKGTAYSEHPNYEELSPTGKKLFDWEMNKRGTSLYKEVNKQMSNISGKPESTIKKEQKEIESEFNNINKNKPKDDRTNQEKQNDKKILESVDNYPEIPQNIASEKQADRKTKELEDEYKYYNSKDFQKEKKRKQIDNEIDNTKDVESLNELQENLEEQGVLKNHQTKLNSKKKELEAKQKAQELEKQAQQDERERENRAASEQTTNDDLPTEESPEGKSSEEESFGQGSLFDDLSKPKETPKQSEQPEQRNLEEGESLQKSDKSTKEGTGASVVAGNYGDRNFSNLSSFETWVRQPIDKKGTNVRISISEDFNDSDLETFENINNLSEEEYREFIENVELKVEVLDSDGHTLRLDDKPVYNYLRKHKTDPRDITYSFRESVIERLRKGEDVTTKVEGMYGLAFDNTDHQNYLEEIFDFSKEDLFVTNRKGQIMTLDGNLSDEFPKTYTTVNKNNKVQAASGMFFYKIKDNRGRNVLAKLNLKKIDNNQADFIYDLFSDLLEGKKLNENLPEGRIEQIKKLIPNFDKFEDTDIISYATALDFFVYHSTNTAGKNSALFLAKGKLHYGNNAETNPNREEFKKWITSQKAHQVKINLFENNEDYRSYILSSNILNTDLSNQIFKPSKNYTGMVFLETFEKAPESVIEKAEESTQKDTEKKSVEQKDLSSEIEELKKLRKSKKGSKPLTEDSKLGRRESDNNQDNKFC